MRNKALICACLLESFCIMTESIGHRSSAAETIWRGKVRSIQVRSLEQAIPPFNDDLKKRNIFDPLELFPPSTIANGNPRAIITTAELWSQSPSASPTVQAETATKIPTALRIRFASTSSTSAPRATETLPHVVLSA